MQLSEKDILNMLFDLMSNFTKIISNFSEAEKLRTIEFYIIVFLGLKGPQKMAKIAEIFSTTKSNVTNIIDSLEEREYVIRNRSKDDRRVILIELTEKGKNVFNETTENFKLIFEDFMKKVSKEDFEIIEKGFEKIISLYR
ncbi:MarR family transcriptional regulator [Marinitoga sp. 1135]|uniref:Transcriptional regulator n=1 Tax=Marinitoga piezophila (strain DSM 14283 / JCM 11233 / KA3) TaxID=443254 RepID=H2J607_MARPK|nr:MULTISPECIES: MarR family transcriptional regulator [Marinitoga]AEX85068.1 transcriptional regulator [Marinitoga piezophila KA3]APT75575.1 MarR family transcriptional regulator [Marinitoga sp. 1137]NUU95283.1 MarR family transcriptional regulator [Marinitoga sp. 1135]NUU97217.1 MarR family transcriptional regulator [Marinitoga sp. 1138]